jgi:hypothetical protein
MRRRPSYEYEPEEDEILTGLLPRNLAIQIFRALLENNASFYGAQMSAMDNATRNAGDMIRKQTLVYNRTRQAMITKELIEIISGPKPSDRGTITIPVEMTVVSNSDRRDSQWLQQPTRDGRVTQVWAPSSTCSSRATCRRFSIRWRPRTAATASCSRFAQHLR